MLLKVSLTNIIVIEETPGKVTDLRVTSSDYTTLSLAWTKPKEVKGSQDEALGYYVEIRPIESPDWRRCNAIPITPTTYTVRGLKAMGAYWVRVVATNYGGDGEPQGFDNHIIAMPPPGKNTFDGLHCWFFKYFFYSRMTFFGEVNFAFNH